MRAQVLAAAEAFGVDLVDVFGAGRPRGEPAALRDHLDAADRIAVARRIGQDPLDLLAGQFASPNVLRRQLLPAIAFCSALAGASMRS